MKLDTPFALDDLRNASCGPQFGGKAERLGVLAQPAQDLPLACESQFGGSTWVRLGGQAIDLGKLGGSPPPTDRRWVDAENLGHEGRRKAFANSLNSQASPLFEFGRGAFGSHTPV